MAETNQEVKFKRGPSSTLPAEKDPGAFLVETDTGNMYLDDTADSRIQITDTRKVNKAGDTMTGPLDMGNQAINNLPEPAGDQNPATKHYVDVAFQEVESELGSLGTTYLPLKGGTMQGEIEMGEYNISSSHQPANPTDLVNKSYVDSQFAGAGTGDFMASGTVPMTGNLQMNNHKITGVSDPTDDTDGANKQYVDNQISTNAKTYTGIAPISVSGTNISHNNIGTAGSAGPTANVSATFGGTFAVPQVTTDAQGHVTGLTARTVTMPAAPSSTDNKVAQTNTSSNANYRVLLSNAANDTTETAGANKNANFYFNPSTGVLTVTKIDTIIDDGVIS